MGKYWRLRQRSRRQKMRARPRRGMIPLASGGNNRGHARSNETLAAARFTPHRGKTLPATAWPRHRSLHDDSLAGPMRETRSSSRPGTPRQPPHAGFREIWTPESAWRRLRQSSYLVARGHRRDLRKEISGSGQDAATVVVFRNERSSSSQGQYDRHPRGERSPRPQMRFVRVNGEKDLATAHDRIREAATAR